MRSPFARMNPTLRGFLIITAIAAVVFVLQLEQTLVAISVLLQIAFLLAIAFFVYMVWRDNRHEISMWPARVQVTFYGAALLIVADIGAYWYDRPSGLDAVAFLFVLAACAFALWRAWRDMRTYT